jgi:outer membrane protein assembly factor BamB
LILPSIIGGRECGKKNLMVAEDRSLLTENSNSSSKPVFPITFVTVVILIVAALAASLYLYGSTTSIPSVNPSSGATVLSKTWDSWNYTVSLNATRVTVGESILVWGNLTYTGQNSITINQVNPSIGLSVYDAAGKLAWMYAVPGFNFIANITAGQKINYYVVVPTSTLKSGTYTIETEPTFGSYPDHQPVGDNMRIKVNFTVVSSSLTTSKETFNSTTTTTATNLTSLCWSTYQHDYQRTGYSTGTAPLSNDTLWVNHDAQGAFASPIVADGKVFVYSGGYTYAIDALTGSTLWKVSSSIGVQPELTYYNGSIIQGTRSSGLEIIDAETGSSSFIHASNSLSAGGGAPIVDDKGVVYFGENHLQRPPNSSASTFFAFYLTNRTKLWEFSLAADEQIISSAAATVDERIIIFSAQNGLHTLNASNGQQLWTFSSSSGAGISGVSVGNGGLVFAEGADGYVYALNQQTGRVIWRTQVASSIGNVNSPAVGDGELFVSAGYKLYALDSETGVIVWSSSLDELRSSPTVSNGLVFAVSNNGVLYALKESDGSIAWILQLPVEHNATLSSAAVCDGVVFVTSEEGVRAIGAKP